MKQRKAASGLITLLASLALVACTPAADKNDPYRIKALAACKIYKAYQRMPLEKRLAYCACVYDKSLSGLSKQEKQVARFYLLAQLNVDVKSMNLLDPPPPMQSMMKASNAIGAAVKRCD